MIKLDGIIVEELAACLEAFLISASGNFGDDAQTQSGGGSGDSVAGKLDGFEFRCLQGAGDMAEQAVFDRIVLGAGGLVVSHSNVALQVGSEVR